MTPESYPRRVLLAVAGLAPQVITETLYALAVAGTPRFVPTEVRVVTTAAGARRVHQALLGGGDGWFHRLCRAYGLQGMRFDDDAVVVITDAEGRALDDIRDTAESLAAADRIAAEVREVTADPDCALHVSLAGGRKTLGFYAGYALSLFGRDQDRLSHVLVSPALEADPAFFFPEPQAASAVASRGDAGGVGLCDIPFVRLRHGLPRPLIAGAIGFADAVAAAQAAVGPAELTIDLGRRQVRAGGRTVRLAPVDLAFLAWMARRVADGLGPVSCPSEGGDEEPARAFLAEYARLAPRDIARTRRALARGMDRAYFESRRSRLNAAFERALGPAAEPYRVRRFGRRPTARYGLAVAVVRFAALGDGRGPEGAS